MHFRRSNRLGNSTEFRSVFQSGTRRRDGLLLAIFKKNNRGIARLGIVVQKKRLARAVDRNRLKRTIREHFRRAQSRLSGLDVLFVFYGTEKDFSPHPLKRSLNRHLRRVPSCERP